MLKQLNSFYSNYRAIAPITLLLIALILIYFSTAKVIFEEWQVGAYSHGLLAIPIALYLFNLDKDKLQLASSIHWLPLLGLIGSMVLWLSAKAANVFFFEIVSLFGIFVSAVGMLHGPAIWSYSFAALLSIFLVMPIWGIIEFPLQAISADVTEVVLRFLGIAVFRNDFTFIVPGGAFLIEPACSGLGFFLSSCLLSVIYAKVFNLSIKKTIFLFMAAVAISIVSNWMRIIIIMVVGNETRMQHPIVDDHLTFGWILFSIMLIPFILIANRLVSPTDGTRSTESADVSKPSWTSKTITREIPIVLLLLIGPLTLYVLENRSVNPQDQVMTRAIYNTLPPYTSRNQSIDWSPTFVGATTIDMWNADYDQKDLMVLLVHYRSQDQGREVIFHANSIYDEQRWKLVEEAVDGPFGIKLLRDNKGSERLIAYAYYINGKLTSNERTAKLLELTGFVLGNRDAYLISIGIDNPASTDPEMLNRLGTILSKKV